jgi:hypothetical protein
VKERWTIKGLFIAFLHQINISVSIQNQSPVIFGVFENKEKLH